MREHGHDGNHHLTNESLDAIASALTGAELAPSAVPAAAPGGGAVAGAEDIYAGVDIRGRTITDIFRLTEAAIDRYPPGELGKAAMIVGLGYISTMVRSICSKVKVEGADMISANLNTIAGWLGDNTIGRPSIKGMEALVGDLMAFAHGFCVDANVLELDRYRAFDNHAARHPTEEADGRDLSKLLKTITPHVEAVAGAIAGLISRVGTAVNALKAVGALPGGAAALPDFDRAALKIDVAEAGMDKMVGIMQKMAGISKGQTTAADPAAGQGAAGQAAQGQAGA
jgi:hypothetical protein